MLRPNYQTKHRQGTIYVAVMGVTLIVALMASVGMAVARLEGRMAATANDQRQAQVLAQTGVEYGVNWMTQNASWRTALTNDTESTQVNLDNGSFSWKAIDSDGDFTDNVNDTVEVQGIGRSGDAVAVESVTLAPGGTGLTCLSAAMHSNGPIVLQGGGFFSRHRINSDQAVSSNGNIAATDTYADIDADAWSMGTISGDVSGTLQPNQSPARAMPTADAFDYYKENGTWIDITSIPDVSGTRTIDKQVLSPASNPYGATNAEGIYVIDCGGAVFEIRTSRVVGTLVILNPGAGSRTYGTLHMAPAVTNYPALLVEGDFRLGHWNLPFVEGSPVNYNFNPIGTPYLGEEDDLQDDNYSTKIEGLVYISGLMTFTGTDSPVVEGCLVSSSVQADASLTVNYNNVFLNYPPPGFAGGDQMEIQRGSWKRSSYAY